MNILIKGAIGLASRSATVHTYMHAREHAYQRCNLACIEIQNRLSVHVCEDIAGLDASVSMLCVCVTVFYEDIAALDASASVLCVCVCVL